MLKNKWPTRPRILGRIEKFLFKISLSLKLTKIMERDDDFYSHSVP
jgi:hypothetical protein